MTRDEFNAFCDRLTATTHVVQWGGADVWKVGGKVFAICGWNDGKDAFTFKASDLAFEVLRDQPGIRPGALSRVTGAEVASGSRPPGPV